MMKRIKKISLAILICVTIFLIVTVVANCLVVNASSDYLTDSILEVTPQKTGLLLGTSPLLKNGKKNPYFYFRIEAAVELYESGKVQFIIVSGDNSTPSYNEPKYMKTELMRRGVPEKAIYLDYAGFRTFDSVIRAKEIFGQSSFIVISQKFHNERAVYIARKNGIDAFGYNARDVSASRGLKTRVREVLARDKVFLDELFGVTPKFLGDTILVE
jgi:SanA protein